jgi:MFS transporter, ACS family, glucarate transporter
MRKSAETPRRRQGERIVTAGQEAEGARRTRVRWTVLAMLFFVTTINYADRATMSMAGSALKTDLHIDAIGLGYIFSAFGWAYVLGQVPGGVLLDRFGSKRVYLASLVIWSSFTLAQSFVAGLTAATAVVTLFVLRFLLGLAEAPSFPANARIVAAWFPHHERGTASAIFNSAQYGSLVIFAPLMGWVVESFGWRYVFILMGGIGLLSAPLFARMIHAPHSHPRISPAEFDYIEQNGALVQLDSKIVASTQRAFSWGIVAQLLSNRMLLGIYLAQYCITALTYFFSTWFPIYLVEARGMSITEAGFGAVAPAACGFVGGLAGGLLSDRLLKSGRSLTFSRKLPVMIGGVLALSIVLANFTTSPGLVIGFMALAFFGKGVASLGWAVISDAAPREVTGLSGSIFNTFGNLAGIVTPIAIGYIVHSSGSFDLALIFVAGHALIAMFSYLVIVGPIRRFALKDPPAAQPGIA